MTLVKILMVAIYVSAVTLYSNPVNSERILALSTIAAQSHWNFMKGVLRALTEHGHQVTVFTSIPDGNRENYTEVDVSKEIELLVELGIDNVHKMLTTHTDVINFLHTHSRDACKSIYANNVMQNIINDPKSSFDVIITEIVASECVSYLSGKLNIPLIYVTPPPLISYMEHAMLGHITNPAYVSHTLADHSVPRSLIQRFSNTILLVYTVCLLRYNSWYESKTDQQPFDLVEAVKPSIVFSNSHYITDASRPLPPSIKSVGGVHLSRPKRIPKDILDFIENSPDGVIFFTLGSIVTISSLPKHTQEDIIYVLAQLPQRVLLKYEDKLVNKPKNVMTRKWFPQRDVLLHPNVKLFISHGGISGVYEAVDAGVPVIGFPVFYDQKRNLGNLVDAGMAIVMDLESISKDILLKNILELVNNEMYLLNAKIASKRFKDRPMSPEQTVDYWTRYVIRHKGAPHLKSHALNLTWYQYLLLDVIAIVLFVLISIVCITYILSRLLYKYFILRVTSKTKLKSN